MISPPASRITRRSLIGATASAPFLRAFAAPLPAPFPEGLTLLVAGLGGGELDGWAEWLTPPLGRAMPAGAPVQKDLVGGQDGVTGANKFEARTVPDGGTALLVPGAAAMAWLVGDPRARYDAGQWIPAMAGVAPGVIASRLSVGQILGGKPVRIAASGPAGDELPAMLALDLLGARWTPVYGATEDAAARGSVDTVFLHGRNVPDAARAMAAAGLPPVICLGTVDEAGRPQRDPSFPGVPEMSELMAGRGGNSRLATAWRATAGASALEMALVLPQQTPAAMVALWRHACAQAADAVQPLAQAVAVRTLASPAATAATSVATPDTASLLELRRWMAERLGYRPG